jgi:hypothetical protein
MMELHYAIARCLTVVERNISKKVDWTYRIDGMALSVTKSNSGGFFPPCGGHLKERIYTIPPRTLEDLVAKLKAAVALLMLTC